MRVLMLSLFVSLTCAAPQGYNYRLELGSAGNSIQAIPNQYNFIQQQQQQQPQIVYQENVPQFQQFANKISSDQYGGYQFGNQLLHNAQQVIQFEQQQHQEIPQQQNIEEVIEIKEQQKHQEVPQQINEQQVKYLERYQEISQQPQQHSEPQKSAPVVEEPPIEIAETLDPPKPVEKQQIIIDPQPQFIIQPKKPTEPEPIYHAQVNDKKITFEKEFYYLSAPKDEDEEDENPKDLEDQLTTLKKNLRVLFIKAPENNGIEKAALKLAQQSINSQTAIYVLTKQHSASDLAQKLQTIQKTTHQRPEVAFIKYRTPEEAEHAQRVIQAQYEALDGPNHINRPVAGVTHNFVGANAGGIEPRQPSVLTDDQVEITKPVSKYLPISVKH